MISSSIIGCYIEVDNVTVLNLAIIGNSVANDCMYENNEPANEVRILRTHRFQNSSTRRT